MNCSSKKIFGEVKKSESKQAPPTKIGCQSKITFGIPTESKNCEEITKEDVPDMKIKEEPVAQQILTEKKY